MDESKLPDEVVITLRRHGDHVATHWSVDCPGGGGTSPDFWGAFDVAAEVIQCWCCDGPPCECSP